jgi:peptidyl-tRNA hydrolase
VSVNESFDRDNHLYLYAIIRTDLEMPVGKLSAQAGHAYTDALKNAHKNNPKAYDNYFNSDLGGSKILLKSKNDNQLIAAYNKAIELGLPCSIIVDRHHIMPPHFDGSPIITALGIGPCLRSEAKQITKKFQCL